MADGPRVVRLKFAPEFEADLRAGMKRTTLRLNMVPVVQVGDELVAINAETGDEIIRGQVVEVWSGPLMMLPIKWYQAEGVDSYLELKRLLARFYDTVRDDRLVVAIEWSFVQWRDDCGTVMVRGVGHLRQLLQDMLDEDSATVTGPSGSYRVRCREMWEDGPDWEVWRVVNGELVVHVGSFSDALDGAWALWRRACLGYEEAAD